MTNQEDKKIKEEFENTLYCLMESGEIGHNNEVEWVSNKATDIMISTFSKALKQAREEERKRILGIVEGMKYKPISKESPEWLRFGVGGYNKALTDIKKVIKK